MLIPLPPLSEDEGKLDSSFFKPINSVSETLPGVVTPDCVYATNLSASKKILETITEKNQ